MGFFKGHLKPTFEVQSQRNHVCKINAFLFCYPSRFPFRSLFFHGIFEHVLIDHRGFYRVVKTTHLAKKGELGWYATFVQRKHEKLSKFALFLVVLDNASCFKWTGTENKHRAYLLCNPLGYCRLTTSKESKFSRSSINLQTFVKIKLGQNDGIRVRNRPQVCVRN